MPAQIKHAKFEFFSKEKIREFDYVNLINEFLYIIELPNVGPIRPDDIEVALKNTRPSAHLHAHLYDKFNDDYGSQILQ